MNSILIVVAALFGLLMGSFLNVVALRFNTGKSLGGRSQCFSCGHVLGWQDLFPVFSFLFQKGRCRYCHSKISLDNIYAELITALFFTLIMARGLFLDINFLTPSYLTSTLFLFIIFSLLIVVLLYDMRHKIIPDTLSLSFGLFALLGSFFFGFDQGVFTYLGFHVRELNHFLAGVIIPLPFVILWLISKGQWIGLGDPKLMVGMGFLFGVKQGVSAIFLSFWIGALFALGLVIINKIFKKTLLRRGKKSIMKTEIPFAPFLIIATLVTTVCNFTII